MGLGKAKNIGTGMTKAKAIHGPVTRRSTAPTATPTTSTRHVLPTPNIYHRHRPVSLFSGPTSNSRVSTRVGLYIYILACATRRASTTRTVALCAGQDHTDKHICILPVSHAQSWRCMGHGHWRGSSMGDCQSHPVVQGSREVEARRCAGATVVWIRHHRQELVYDKCIHRPRVYADVAPPVGWTDPLHIKGVCLLSLLTNESCVGFLTPLC